MKRIITYLYEYHNGKKGNNLGDIDIETSKCLIEVKKSISDLKRGQIKKYTDPRIKLIHHEVNRYTAEARNTGIDNATGEYLAFVDPDDYLDYTFLEKLYNLDMPFWSSKLAIDEYTLEDIVQALKQPTRDYRDDFAAPILRSDILKIENLKNGMKLQGTVRNVVDFGAFVDIGLKNDGLVHISQMSNDYIKHPLDVVSVGDIVDCYVKDINLEKGKVQLSFLEK